MTRRKVMIGILVVVLMLLSLGYYIKTSSDRDLKTLEKDTIKIAFLMDSLVIERWQKDRDIFMSRAKELGAEVTIKSANEDLNVQISQVRDCIDEKIDVIVIIPSHLEGLSGALKQARNNGIKVIAYDRLPMKSFVDLYISFDNYKVGEMMGNELVKRVPKGNYLVINGSPKDNNAFMFKAGYDAVLKPFIDRGDINVIGDIWAVDWREIHAYDAVNRILDDKVQIDAIIGANDDLAEGAIKALLERQLASDVAVAGQDANLSACQRIAEGTQMVTIYKPIKDLAKTAAEYAINLANNKNVDVTERIHDGESYVPYVKLDPIVVTAETMVDVIVNGGFHSKENVYRNIPEDKWPK